MGKLIKLNRILGKGFEKEEPIPFTISGNGKTSQIKEALTPFLEELIAPEHAEARNPIFFDDYIQKNELREATTQPKRQTNLTELTFSPDYANDSEYVYFLYERSEDPRRLIHGKDSTVPYKRSLFDVMKDFNNKKLGFNYWSKKDDAWVLDNKENLSAVLREARKYGYQMTRFRADALYNEEIETILQQYEDGVSLRRIAQNFEEQFGIGMNKHNVYDILDKYANGARKVIGEEKGITEAFRNGSYKERDSSEDNYIPFPQMDEGPNRTGLTRKVAAYVGSIMSAIF